MRTKTYYDFDNPDDYNDYCKRQWEEEEQEEEPYIDDDFRPLAEPDFDSMTGYDRLRAYENG